MSSPVEPVRVGVDTGGTFTDFVLDDGERLRVHKEPSTPANPAAAVIAGVHRLVDGPFDVVHGSTVATNALLERRGARTALLTTLGFEDLLLIGRQARRQIYAIDVDRPPPLVDRALTFGVRERLAADGSVVEPLLPAEAARVAERVRAAGVEAVAICLLHAYADGAHERALQEALRRAGFAGYVCASSEVLPEFREFERCSTITINAYVGPVMDRYLAALEDGLGARTLQVLQSNGGAMAPSVARAHPVHTILSGPAGGVVGAFELARAAGHERVITFDMGGTSTDVSLCPGRLQRSTESAIGGLPVRVPVLDVHTVGAGGGSIAWIDPGGALRVGPRSAGADPGPACYGRGGTDFTVTDANLLLGRLHPEHFLGGAAAIDAGAAAAAGAPLARRLGMSLEQLAEGVVRIADTRMEGALRVISVERGFDPREFTLVCFGGAGGMHAAGLAEAMGIRTVVVPPAPGALSAHGMLLADAVRDFSRSVLRPVAALERDALEAFFAELEQRAADDELLRASPEPATLLRALDLRYRGQGYELTVPYGERFVDAFHRAHAERYGYADPDRPVELVAVRLEARAPRPRPRSASIAGDRGGDARLGNVRVRLQGSALPAALLARPRLRPGDLFAGPALLVEYSSTTWVPPGWHASVDCGANLVLERRT